MSDFIKKNIFKILLVLILILSIFLRFYKLGSNPPSIDWDEASIGYNAYSILKTGADEYGNRLPLSFRSFDDFKPPVYIYLTVPSVAVFGLNEFAVRLPAAVIGVLSIIAVYYLVMEILKNWDNKKKDQIALLSAFFLAISPWHLQFSRAAFEGNVGMFFLILAVLCFFKAFNDKRLLVLFVISFVLSIYSYHSFRLINPIILLVLVVIYNKELIRQKSFFFISLAAIVILSSFVYSSFFIQQGTGARLSMVTIFSDPEIRRMSAEKVLEARRNGDFIGEIIYNRRVIFIPAIISGYLDHFNFDFLFLHGDSGVQHHAYNMGMLFLWDFPFVILGLLFLLKKLNKRIITLLIIFLLAPLPSAITTGTPHPVRAIAMIPVFQIFAAVGVVFGLQLFKKNKIPAAFIISILLALNVGFYLYSYYVLTPIRYGYFWQYGYKEAFAYAKQNEVNFDKIYVTYEYDQPYIYYLFYNKVDPFWYQKNWNYNGNGSVDRFYRKIGKYEFKNIDLEKDKKLTKTLIIGSSKEIPDGTPRVIKTVYFPDGKVAFRIVGT